MVVWQHAVGPPVMYVPESQRDQVLAVYDSAYSEAKRKGGSKIFQLSRAEAIARGLPSPTRHDVQDSMASMFMKRCAERWVYR